MYELYVRTYVHNSVYVLMYLCMYTVCVHVIHILLFLYCTYTRDNHKDKDDYKGSVELHGNTDAVQVLQYAYARTDAARVRNCIKYIVPFQSTFIAT